jgi:S-adenosylmethionine hydrolase
MAKSLIALVSDFGTRDHYVGAMKGVIYSINPEATVVDVSHDLPPHDIAAAADELSCTYKYFPPGTVFLVVIDPGVGSARRGIAAEAGEWRFVAPDNGVLSGVFAEFPPKKIVELTERRYARPTVSRTFEGRDRFAPAAAWLSKGVHLPAFGRPISDPAILERVLPSVGEASVSGIVTRVDRFGNVITNLDRRTCERLTDGMGVLRLEIAGNAIHRIVSTYTEINPGEVAALFGSTDHLECAMRAERAADRLGVKAGDSVVLSRVSASA